MVPEATPFSSDPTSTPAGILSLRVRRVHRRMKPRNRFRLGGTTSRVRSALVGMGVLSGLLSDPSPAWVLGIAAVFMAGLAVREERRARRTPGVRASWVFEAGAAAAAVLTGLVVASAAGWVTLTVPTSGQVMAAMCVGMGLLAVREFRGLALGVGALGSRGLVQSGTALLIVLGWLLPPPEFGHVLVPVLVMLLIAAFAVHMARHGADDALRSVPISFFGPVYVGVPLALAMQILQVDRMFLLFGLLCVWMSDTGAYAAGRQFGRTKLAPVLSPKKTVEGFVGGIALAMAVAALFKLGAPASSFRHGWPATLGLALATGVLAPVGDLAESALKRDAGVKDSGRSGTGHGGVLDRLDSLLFCFVLMYGYLVAMRAL